MNIPHPPLNPNHYLLFPPIIYISPHLLIVGLTSSKTLTTYKFSSLLTREMSLISSFIMPTLNSYKLPQFHSMQKVFLLNMSKNTPYLV